MQTNATLPIAKSVIAKLGGPVAVGRIVGRSHSAVCKWQVSPSEGGTGGLIPARHQGPLLAYARRNGIPLGPEDFIPPLPSDEVAA